MYMYCASWKYQTIQLCFYIWLRNSFNLHNLPECYVSALYSCWHIHRHTHSNWEWLACTSLLPVLHFSLSLSLSPSFSPSNWEWLTSLLPVLHFQLLVSLGILSAPETLYLQPFECDTPSYFSFDDRDLSILQMMWFRSRNNPVKLG